MFWMPLIMAGASLIKNREAQAQANAERKRQAQMTRYSPWTGMVGQTVQNPSLVGDVAQGAMSGMAMQQNMASADQQKELMDAYLNSIKSGGKVGYGMPMTSRSGYEPQ